MRPFVICQAFIAEVGDLNSMAKQGAGRFRRLLCTTTVYRDMQVGIAEGLKKWYEPPQKTVARAGAPVSLRERTAFNFRV